MQNNTQRNSPSSPNLSAETTEGAGEGLDVTACSASYLERVIQRTQIAALKSSKELSYCLGLVESLQGICR
jgi:hypothetical protein